MTQRTERAKTTKITETTGAARRSGRRLRAPESAPGAAGRLLFAAAVLVGVCVVGVLFTGGGLSAGPFMTATIFDLLVPLLALPLALLCVLLALAAPALGRGRRRAAHLGLGAAGAMAGALALLLAAGSLASGPAQLTCPGARARLQPAAATGGTLEFTGGMGEHHTPPFVAAEGWRVAWTSDRGELHLRLYDPTHPQWRPTRPGRGPAYLGAVLDASGHEPTSGGAVQSQAGVYCLTISSGYHYEPGVDTARLPRPRWRVTVEGVRP
jgi:hypothetical protein